MDFFVYILECSDTTLYIGSTTDIERRLHQHNNLKSGAKYTRARRPVRLVYSEKLSNLNEARKKEHKLKKLNRKEKLEMIKQQHQLHANPQH